ncbi:PREDICTED: uncharacterized protein LOC106127624 [Papilio xuthus]|uniref:Uncharacterized protein LOC106127624 n=1 Tax=Papilio xuthus TaxID=66420 RepID=I4DIS7_PAPXU|nr:uncharacterized protein LOC106127624 precursor [Papilio xuthus]BAM17817.1 unknown secreted protein [Papilio xuthus]
MELLKFTTLLCCICVAFASEHKHIIPVENYDTELQDLGQHVEIPETPVRVVKITKTIAVKIPVPYPVKVVEKVPYPVHVSKPYPVPVPQIVKVPHVISSKDKIGHEALDSPYQGHGQFGGNTYQVQEHASDGYGPDSENVYHGDGGYGSGSQGAGDEHSLQSSNEDFAGAGSHYSHPGNQEDVNTFESDSYNQAIKNYLANHGSGNQGHVPHY